MPEFYSLRGQPFLEIAGAVGPGPRLLSDPFPPTSFYFSNFK